MIKTILPRGNKEDIQLFIFAHRDINKAVSYVRPGMLLRWLSKAIWAIKYKTTCS
jgi:hypothetical protein